MSFPHEPGTSSRRKCHGGMNDNSNEPRERRRGRHSRQFRRDAAAIVLDQHRVAARSRESSASTSRLLETGSARSASTGPSRGTDERGARRAHQAGTGGEALVHGARPARSIGGLLGEGVDVRRRYRHVDLIKAEHFPSIRPVTQLSSRALAITSGTSVLIAQRAEQIDAAHLARSRQSTTRSTTPMAVRA
jgi:hypothetical protein